MSNQQNRIHYALFGAAAFLLSLYFSHMHILMCDQAEKASLDLLLTNNADTPFQYRVLVPWLVQSVSRWLSPNLLSPIQMFRMAEFFFTFSLCIVFRSYINLFIEDAMRSSVYALSIFLLLPYQYIFYSPSLHSIFYPSDVPSVFFFTLGLILIYKKNWFLYYPIFAIATFNRETTIFLVFICWITAISKTNMLSVTSQCLVQMVLWVLIKQFLAVLYADNPGPGFFVNFISTNWMKLGNPLNVIRIASSFCFVWVAVLYRFSCITSDFLKRTTFVIFPYLVGMFIVGNIIELRIFGELIPVVLIVFWVIIDRSLFQFQNQTPCFSEEKAER
ncbi:hypothetical protein [Desulfatirhabdium butyrativorans]|uniref:hypothetical protein n=1 Tax=Desulfatirhabdium butyrativorans TaxID=340467 RepID=UPI00041A897A|nr:hypothetical protein [Desulfatirhabdium butyrativorans]